MAYIGKTPTVAPLTSSDVADGIITNAKLAQDIISADTALGAEPADTDEFLVSDAGVLKRMDYSYIKAAGGIAEADQWRITANLSMSSLNSETDITANWERRDEDSTGQLGTGMSQSSGIFTFPSTGFWLISVSATYYQGGADFMTVVIKTTTDDSSYDDASFAKQATNTGTNNFASSSNDFLFDVTDTSNCKVKFAYLTEGTAVLVGDTNVNATHVTFMKLGDT